MLNLIKSITRSRKSINFTSKRAINNRTFIDFDIIFNNPKPIINKIPKNNVVKILKKINSTVPKNIENQCIQQIYNITLDTILKFVEHGFFTQAIQNKFNSVAIIDEYNIRTFLPERCQLDSPKYMDQLVAKYPTIYGFKLSTVNDGYPLRKFIVIDW